MPKIAQRRTKIAQRRKKTSRGQGNGGFTEDRRQKTRKLRKLNDGGKLEVVQVKTHSTSDFNDMVLRSTGRKRRKSERGRRVTTEYILECEGGRLVP